MWISPFCLGIPQFVSGLSTSCPWLPPPIAGFPTSKILFFPITPRFSSNAADAYLITTYSHFQVQFSCNPSRTRRLPLGSFHLPQVEVLWLIFYISLSNFSNMQWYPNDFYLPSSVHQPSALPVAARCSSSHKPDSHSITIFSTFRFTLRGWSHPNPNSDYLLSAILTIFAGWGSFFWVRWTKPPALF